MTTSIQVTIFSSQTTGEKIRITRYNYDALCEWEKDTEIGDRLDGWRAAGGVVQPYSHKRIAERQHDDAKSNRHVWEKIAVQSHAPHENDFTPTGDNVERAVVGMPNPVDYRTVNTVGVIRPERIGAMDNQMLARHLSDVLSLVKESHVPIYEQVDYRTGRTLNDGKTKEEVNFCHVLLPVANGDGNITTIYSVRRHIGSPTDIFPPPDLAPEIQKGRW
ncbi:MAG: hypothetical protein MJE12_17355 [Alphaproteobacteria bacterium]|nr:hypothetical protein [Alphaproteobacteria bacterium]